MYIPPLLLVVPEFAIDFCEERKQLFDIICLKEGQELNDIINEISDYCSYYSCNADVFGYGCGDYNVDGDNYYCSGDGSDFVTSFGYGFGHSRIKANGVIVGFGYGYCPGFGSGE